MVNQNRFVVVCLLAMAALIGITMAARSSIRASGSAQNSPPKVQSPEVLADSSMRNDRPLPNSASPASAALQYDWMSVENYIPIELLPPREEYATAESISVNYGYPKELAVLENGDMGRVFGCGELREEAQLISPRLYLLNDADGNLYLPTAGGFLSTKIGTSSATINISELMKEVDIGLGENSKLSKYRFIFLASRPPMPSRSLCSSGKEWTIDFENPGAAGNLKWIATSTLRGIGFSSQFQLH